MAYPATLDSLTTPNATDKTNSPSHAGLHGSANTAISAIETKLGVDSSAVTTSVDYLLKSTSSVNPGHKHSSASISGVSGSGNVVLVSSPTLVTPTLGAASATSINKVAITAPATSATLTIDDGATLHVVTGGNLTMSGKNLIINNSLTLAGTDSTTMTFPGSSATLAGLGIIQTFTALNTFKQINFTNNAIAASSNAATVPITHRLNTVTNSSAATLTITMTTTSAVDGQLVIVRILDFSAVAQTITWVNTEDSTVVAPTTSNGSTSLFLTAGFMFNGSTSKWRCLASC